MQVLFRLINVIGTLDIKAITGVRRSGKSKPLDAFKEYIVKENPYRNIIDINFNLPDFDELLEYRPLYDYVNEHFAEGKEKVVWRFLSLYRSGI